MQAPGDLFPGASLHEFLEYKVRQYSRASFIETDPISIPHRFLRREDREIAGFLAATISWGQRKTILANAGRLMQWMDDAPYAFITGFREADLKPFRRFVHRTFNGTDCIAFLRRLQAVYRDHGGLQCLFEDAWVQAGEMKGAIAAVRRRFLAEKVPSRTYKHFPDPERGSAAKRLNMFLRWMVRRDDTGVDFGMWKGVPASGLICPLDVHSGRVARRLGLLSRKQDDWRAADELTASLRQLDAADPVKYDFALFGLGVFEGF
jgi:uncharacterized protein (TIGR02757 family)